MRSCSGSHGNRSSRSGVAADSHARVCTYPLELHLARDEERPEHGQVSHSQRRQRLLPTHHKKPSQQLPLPIQTPPRRPGSIYRLDQVRMDALYTRSRSTYRTARFPLVVSLVVECALSVVENSLRLSRDALEGSREPTLKVWTAPLSEVRRRSLRKAGSLMDVVRVITNRAIRYGAGAAGAVQHPIVGSVRLEVEVWAEVAGKGFLKIELIAEDNETVGRSVRCVCIGGEKRRKQRGGHDSREDVGIG